MPSDVGEEIYTLVSLFPGYKSLLEETHRGNEGLLHQHCSSFKKDITQHENTEYDKFCPQILGYLSDVKANHKDHLIDSGCKYLYYWLYYVYLKEQKSSEEAFNLYESLLVNSSGLNDDVCEEYKQMMNKDTLRKIRDLDNMNEKLNSIQNKNAQDGDLCKCARDCARIYMTYQETCSESKEINFCHELEIIRGRYNNLVNTIVDCDAEKWLQSFNGNNPIVTILIPLFTILLMSFTLFILYKVNNSFS